MTIRELFSNRRPIDRPIEKVIDYYATEENRLRAEIEEYEVTRNVEECFRKFLELYDHGVSTGQVTEIGVWVAGFYGAGKSSFTKYLGFALDRGRTVGGRPFLELLTERITSVPLQASLRTLAAKHRTAVILLDLGAEQLADTTLASVSTVLYYKVLQYAGYSKEKKLAELELKLEQLGRFDEFKKAYRDKFGDDWENIHNDAMIGVARAAHLVPDFFPEYPTPESFRQVRFEAVEDLRERAQRIIELVRRKSGAQNILFLIDEAGQYVAPRGDLILNLDGLARNFKQLGQGRVWIVATGQQTLAEIVEKAAYNSAELNKLRDRFPIAINLEPSDIREITYRRLLAKSAEGERRLKQEFGARGQALVASTRLTGTALYKGDPDAETFARLYPFLPQHFDLLLELIRTLARSTGGLGLRSAIRVLQDLLVDASKVLPPDATKLADRPVGTLACVDHFYDTLRADIAKVLPHVVRAVDRIASAEALKDQPLTHRVAKAIAALQAVEGFPRTADNIGALLYPAIGAPSLQSEVREALRKLAETPDTGVVEDPQAGGYLFLSEGVKPLRDKRNAHMPTALERNQVRAKLLASIFDPPPSAKIENVKDVKAGVSYGKIAVVGEDAEIQFRVEAVDAGGFEERRTALLVETNTLPELKNTIVWLIKSSDEVEDLITDACRSDWVTAAPPEREADKDVAQFLRAERRAAERSRDRAGKLLKTAMLEGAFVFRGKPTPVREAAETIEAASRAVLAQAAAEIFPYLRLVSVRPNTDLAVRFLSVERLDRMPRDNDPLALVALRGGSPRIDVNHPALAEALRSFQQKLDESGSRLQGSFIQDFFAGPPYGWSKDATRYLFAALLLAGEIEMHTASGVVRTSGPHAQEAFKNTVAFNRLGVSRRDSRPSAEALDRAASRLQEVFGIDVLPLEDHVSGTVLSQVPTLIEKIASLPDRLRLLGLPGEERARRLLETCSDLIKDGAAAAAMLGGTQSSFTADARWAREVSDALDAGAESEIRAARGLDRDLADLASLFPAGAAGLVSAEDEAAIREALSSENFHQKLPMLRSAVRAATDKIRQRYDERRARFGTAVQDARNTLEAMPEWLLISTEDRDEIVASLDGSQLPATMEPGRETASLCLLLARESGQRALQAELEQEVRRRVPATSPVSEPGPEEEMAEEEVDVNQLPMPDVIRTRVDLDAWLAALRQQLADLLRQKKVIRLRR